MKKILFSILLALLVATPVSAYVIQKGDTPFGLWGSNWFQEMSAQIGHTDQYNLPVGVDVNLYGEILGGTPTPTSSASIKYVEAPDFYAYSPAVAGDTTITINDLVDIYGNTLTMANFGALGYGRIDPDGDEVSESFTFSGVTANSDGTYTLTGVKSVLAVYPYTQTSGLVRSHSINAIVRFTNTAALYDNFANKENNEIIDVEWTFNAFPIVSSSTALPDSNGEFATKYYVDTVGAGGFTSVNVSTTLGLEALGTSPETVGINASSTTGMAFDSSGALYQKTSSTAGILTNSNGLYVDGNYVVLDTDTTSTPTASKIPIADGSGKLGDGWVGATTAGDIVYSDGTDLQRLGIGTANQVLATNSSGTIPVWSNVPLYYVSASDNLKSSADTAEAQQSEVNQMRKEIITLLSGTFRIKFSCRTEAGGTSGTGRIYKNGTGYGTAQSCTAGAGLTTFSEDLYFQSGDRIQLWIDCYTNNAADKMYFQDFRLYYDINATTTYDRVTDS